MTLGALAYSLAPIVVTLALFVFFFLRIRAARGRGSQRDALLWLAATLVTMLAVPVFFGFIGRIVN